MMHPLDAQVCTLMRDVATQIVMPHFQQLAADDIIEKEPGDLVTVADRLSEEALTAGLLEILPEARVVGEEAVAADPHVRDAIESGLVWIVDPIDGTGNYAAGVSPFAIMIALARDGVVEGGWILDPVSGRMLHAHLNGGAFIDGEPVHSRSTDAAQPVAAITTRYLPEDVRGAFDARMAGTLNQVPIPKCAGEQYPRLVLGENDVALYWRTYPWDHAPGALFLTEAGGRVATLAGAPYHIGMTGHGLLAAATPQLWDTAAAILNG